MPSRRVRQYFHRKWSVMAVLTGCIMLWYLLPVEWQPTFFREYPQGSSLRFPVDQLLLSLIACLALALLGGVVAALVGPRSRRRTIYETAAAFTFVLAVVAYTQLGRPGVPKLYLLMLPVLSGAGVMAALPVLQGLGVAIDESS